LIYIPVFYPPDALQLKNSNERYQSTACKAAELHRKLRDAESTAAAAKAEAREKTACIAKIEEKVKKIEKEVEICSLLNSEFPFFQTCKSLTC